MAPKDSNDCVVTVTIELGHQAKFLEQPSPEGFTHDWTVFVRGYEGSRLEYFVEKVVFKLHKTFKSPCRVISEPPFKVTESGYAGFILPIEIYFKNKQTPRKIVFQYDLFLNAIDSPPINNVRYEKLKFQNPIPEFKTKLLKAGGIEQGLEPMPCPKPDVLGSPVKVEKKKVSKPPKDKEKDKEKVKKKKSTPPAKFLSPAESLASLSSLSSDDDDDDEDEEDSYVPRPPPPPPKKEKDNKKEGSSSLSHFKDSSSSSSHKEKSKHRSSSTSSVHKDQPGSEKDSFHKSHKHKSKDKDRERSASQKDKENGKKDKDSSAPKLGRESQDSQKDRDGSHSSFKNSSSSSQGEKKYVTASSSTKDKEKISSSKDRDASGTSSHKEKHRSSSKEKGKSSKHASSKDSGLASIDIKKEKDDVGKEKSEKRHKDKKHKRPSESPKIEEEMDRKKLKCSPSLTSSDDRPPKSKSSSSKEKDSSKDIKEKVSPRESKEKDAKSSSKPKSEKSKHSEKHKHSHSSESKQKDGSGKKTDPPQKAEKLGKSDSLTKSERLAMTADFQPQLLLSPLKSPPNDEELAASPGPADKASAKWSTRSRSPSISSLSSGNASDAGEKYIRSGLTDSDSDSEDDVPPVKSPQKELKSAFSKQATQLVHKSKSSTAETPVRRGSHEEQVRKIEADSAAEEIPKKLSKEERKAAKLSNNKRSKQKYPDHKSHSTDEEDVDHVNDDSDIANNQHCDGLDIAAPNGIPLRDLIAINEKIEKAQEVANREVLEKVLEIIGETDDFDINDEGVYFDICSVEKDVVLQIQAALRDL